MSFREIVAQLAQFKLGNDKRLLDEAGQWLDESRGHKVGAIRAAGPSPFGGDGAEIVAGIKIAAGIVHENVIQRVTVAQ